MEENQYATPSVDFAVIRDGAFYSLQERLYLVNRDDARIIIRSVASALVTWLPLLILTALAGTAVTDDPQRSFLLNLPCYGRFLIALPLLVVADNIVDDRCVTIASYFANSGVVPDTERASYDQLLSFTKRLGTSTAAEITILVLAYIGSITSVLYTSSDSIASWKFTDAGSLSAAGWWFMLVSLPLFQFLLYRWVWRLIIWCLFLFRFSRLELRLVPVHPDTAGGLGILSESVYAFIPVFFALSALVSSVWCMRVLYGGEHVADFHRPGVAFLAALALISILPLLIFIRPLYKLKLNGLHNYGILANKHAVQFDEKWVRDAEKNLPEVLGTADISSLCDMTTDYTIVQSIKFFPYRWQNLAIMVASLLIPMIPLVLTEIPLKDLVKKIGGSAYLTFFATKVHPAFEFHLKPYTILIV